MCFKTQHAGPVTFIHNSQDDNPSAALSGRVLQMPAFLPDGV